MNYELICICGKHIKLEIAGFFDGGFGALQSYSGKCPSCNKEFTLYVGLSEEGKKEYTQEQLYNIAEKLDSFRPGRAK